MCYSYYLEPFSIGAFATAYNILGKKSVPLTPKGGANSLQYAYVLEPRGAVSRGSEPAQESPDLLSFDFCFQRMRVLETTTVIERHQNWKCEMHCP